MKIIAPLYIILPRKTKADKKILINLNNYPRWHFRVYAEIKKIFCEEMRPQLINLKLETPILLQYNLLRNSKRKIDRMNILAVIDKFFCDSLVYYKCIPDDNDYYIRKQIFETNTEYTGEARIEIEIIKSINS